MARVAINGFGRIGRMVGRAVLEKNSKNICANLKEDGKKQEARKPGIQSLEKIPPSCSLNFL